MTLFKFKKFHGAGNDFIICDGKDTSTLAKPGLISRLCARSKGIGADGVIFIYKENDLYRMVIINSDGSRAEMCGNGLRCAAMYITRYISSARTLYIKTEAGIQYAEITGKDSVKVAIPLLEEVREVNIDGKEIYYANTGVPHAVLFCEKPENINLPVEGPRIRFHEKFKPAGVNVNFISVEPDSNGFYAQRTYERGVEGETFSCGTGAAAAALCIFKRKGKTTEITFKTRFGEELRVELAVKHNIVKEIRLAGKALEVFSGEFDISRFS
jgi:diaminopimelate epimerase